MVLEGCLQASAAPVDEHAHAQEHRIRAALHELEAPGVDQQAWRCLAGAVESSGSAGLRGLLGWQLYKVPNISGAQGKRTARRNLRQAIT